MPAPTRTPAPSARSAGAVWAQLWRRRTAAVLGLGCLGVCYALGFLGQSKALDYDPSTEEVVVLLGLGALFVGVEYPRARWSARRAFTPVATWLDRGGAPSPDELDRLHQLPNRHGRTVAIEWTSAVAIALLVRAGYEVDPAQLAVLAIGGTVLGLHMGWFVHLLVESALRTEFALAAELSGERHRVGPAQRLVVRLGVTIVLCLGVVILGVVILLTYPDNGSGVDLALATVPLTFFVLLEGGAIVAWTIGSLTDTIARLRSGLRAIESGDLSVQVPVDDRSEVGELQQSFNQMVVGLRDRDLLERLLAGQVGASVAAETRSRGVRLHGERRRATVLFVDMIGSTGLATEVAPEWMVDLLNGYFDLVVRRVTAEGGEVLQFQGDGAISVFGAPVALDDHATVALRVARTLGHDIAALRRREPRFDAGISVATGEVVVGHVGNRDRHSYTVVGDAANTAGRLVDEAKRHPARVLATSVTVEAAAADEGAHWLVAGDVELRGRGPTPVHAVAGVPG